MVGFTLSKADGWGLVPDQGFRTRRCCVKYDGGGAVAAAAAVFLLVSCPFCQTLALFLPGIPYVVSLVYSEGLETDSSVGEVGGGGLSGVENQHISPAIFAYWRGAAMPKDYLNSLQERAEQLLLPCTTWQGQSSRHACAVKPTLRCARFSRSADHAV